MVRQRDIKCVIDTSNYDRINLIATVTFSKREKRRVAVEQPRLINNYDKHEGEIYQQDMLVGKYGINIRDKNWRGPNLQRF